MPHILENVQGQMKEVCWLIEPCLLIGTREYPSLIVIFDILTFSPSQIEILQTVKDADGEAIQNNARHLKDHDHPPAAN